jgi:hypothetical protein
VNTFDLSQNQATRRISTLASAAALAATLTLSLTQPAHAGDDITPPVVPDTIKVPDGNTPFLLGHATGTQNYECQPSGSGFAWVLFTPEATLFNNADKQVTTHFFSPNPDPTDANTDPRVVADGTIRAAWQARDTSTVWAKLFVPPSTDAAFVRQGAVAWLLLVTAGVQEGPTGGDTLTRTTFIHRVNTDGGLAPATGCAQLSDVGKKAFMPYTADYFFYQDANADD